jgi:hypothetical protein
MKDAIRLTLLENAESFVNEALDKALDADKEPSEWKFAILNLVQAVELVLKEILRREHWTLIFQNVDKRTNTVSLEGALDRLTSIAKVQISDSDVAAVKDAIRLRNQIVHYEVTFEEAQAKLVFVKLLGFVQQCFGRYLGKLLHEVVHKELWEAVIDFFEFSEELSKRAVERLAAEGLAEVIRFECPRCSCDFFVAKNCPGICYVCGYEEYIDQCAMCKGIVFSDSGSEIHDGVICCNDCLERGVLFSPTSGVISSLDDYEEIEEEEAGQVYLRRKRKAGHLESPNPAAATDA